MAERVGIFIDGPNLYGGARRLTGEGRVDIAALTNWIAAGRTIAEMAFWTGVLDQSQDAEAYARQRRFFSHIEQQIPNSRVGRGTIQRRGNRQVEKGVDVGVALDLLAGAYEDRWDVGVVVSGDGDLARAGKLVKQMGKGFEVVCCSRTLSGLLRNEANGLIVLTEETLPQFQS